MSGKNTTAQKLGETRSSPRNLSALDLKSQPPSPSFGTPSPNRSSLYSPCPLTGPGGHISGNQSPSQHSQDSPSNKKGKKAKKLSCPCLRSTAGKDWLYPCCECGQNWHASCANLKGTNAIPKTQEATVKKIGKDWLCPWCWVCPIPKPGSHPSTQKEISLIKETLSACLYENITETLTKSIKTALTPVDLSPIQSQLEKLSNNIEEFKLEKSTPHLAPQDLRSNNTRPVRAVTRKTLKAPMQPFEEYKDDYLNDDDLGNLADLLGKLKDDGDFMLEKGHGVYQYGEPYSYTGSRNPDSNEPIPDELNQLIEKLTTDLSLEEKPNSVLINHFPPCENRRSHLAKHSDDEPCITAESKIITISVGGTRKVVFESKHDESEPQVLNVKSNSLYVMSRTSQNWWYHSVPPQEADEEIEERFSITFRTLSKKFSQSILLMGDSNTEPVNFGTGSGRVGVSYPGKRVKAGRVKDIDAAKCVGYQNVFLHCGTNDLRCEYIKSREDIHQLVDQLHDKLSELKQICPKAKIFVVPVLPSRISSKLAQQKTP